MLVEISAFADVTEEGGGNIYRGSLMAGQSVGMVTKEEPLADIIATLMAEAAQRLWGALPEALAAPDPGNC